MAACRFPLEFSGATSLGLKPSSCLLLVTPACLVGGFIVLISIAGMMMITHQFGVESTHPWCLSCIAHHLQQSLLPGTAPSHCPLAAEIPCGGLSAQIQRCPQYRVHQASHGNTYDARDLGVNPRTPRPTVNPLNMAC